MGRWYMRSAANWQRGPDGDDDDASSDKSNDDDDDKEDEENEDDDAIDSQYSSLLMFAQCTCLEYSIILIIQFKSRSATILEMNK